MRCSPRKPKRRQPGFDPNLWKWSAGPDTAAFWIYNLLFVAIPIAAVFVLPHGKTVGVTILLAEIGVAFYMYLPFASEQNPSEQPGTTLLKCPQVQTPPVKLR